MGSSWFLLAAPRRQNREPLACSLVPNSIAECLINRAFGRRGRAAFYRSGMYTRPPFANGFVMRQIADIFRT
ncbi:MAG TPA: hypothetical protein VJZ74_05935, partial [Pseudolabrys sp.]|nr:hypothetical protein [Pseudolabrys sp.]